jgi:hypothetical protein
MGMKQMPPRKNQRFIVSPHFPMQIQIPKSISKIFKLKTIGPGGLGFYGTPRDAKLLQAGEMDLDLMAGQTRIPFRGKVQYSRFLPMKDGGVNYIGIEFHEIDKRTDLILKTLLAGGLSKGHLIIT